MTRIAILTATKIEFNAISRVFPKGCPVPRFGPTVLEGQVGSNRVWLIQTGMGLTRARSITRQILTSESWDVVISSGFAGALNCSAIGSLVIGHEVVVAQSEVLPDADPPGFACHPDWVRAALDIQGIASPSPQTGRFVTVDHALTRASQKHALGERTGAVAVDMESGAIGQVAQEHGFPFLIVRAISDGVNEDLPVDFNVFLKPSGWLLGARQVLLTPACWKGFFRLYRNSKQAGIQLSNFFEKFLYAHQHEIPQTVKYKSERLNP